MVIFYILGYLKDSNAAAHSVDSDIFHSGLSKTFVSHYYCQIVLCNLKSVLVCVNFMHDDASMARCDKGSWQKKHIVI